MKELLIIEDDKHLAEMYAKKFRASGFQVTIAKDGTIGMRQARDKKPDMIILDIMLPGISGVGVLEILRTDKKTAKIPVVVYTNSNEEANKKKCLTYGADEYILKIDSTPESLCETINRVLTGKRIETI